MATVLITQCLQRDFIDPIGPHDPVPNLLHVGHREATRLLGPQPSAGPLAQLINWARGLAPEAIDLVHIRDWHDPGDPAQREHLQRFGAHCIKGPRRPGSHIAVSPSPTRAHPRWLTPSTLCDGAARRRSEATTPGKLRPSTTNWRILGDQLKTPDCRHQSSKRHSQPRRSLISRTGLLCPGATFGNTRPSEHGGGQSRMTNPAPDAEPPFTRHQEGDLRCRDR